MKLLDFIVCDDIRQEISGKHILIGIYYDMILHKQKEELKWPLKFKLGFFIRIKLEKSDPVPDSFNVEFIHKDNKFKTIKGNLKIIGKTEYIVLSLIHGGFPIPNIGKINFRITLKRDNHVIWKEEPNYSMGVKLEQK